MRDFKQLVEPKKRASGTPQHAVRLRGREERRRRFSFSAAKRFRALVVQARVAAAPGAAAVLRMPEAGGWRRIRLYLAMAVALITALTFFTMRPPSPAAAPAVSFAKVYQDPHLMLGLGFSLLPKARLEGGAYRASTPDGGVATLSLVPELQQRLEQTLTRAASAYAAVLVFEPKTGRILAAAAQSAVDPLWTRLAFGDTYPMASLFKLVTASAAFDGNRAAPGTTVAFRGRLASDAPKGWHVTGGRGQSMTLTNAMAHSANPVFGNLAADFVGADLLQQAIRRTGFNENLYRIGMVRHSTAPMPTTPGELRLEGAGLEKAVRVSPLHVAALLGAIGNGGTAPQLALIDAVQHGAAYDFRQHPAPLASFFTPRVAGELIQTMSGTVYNGTARKPFATPRGRQLLARVDVAAKTGSINGVDPAGYYNWFVALAPRSQPRVAVVALVVNRALWHIKGADLGVEALDSFLSCQRPGAAGR